MIYGSITEPKSSKASKLKLQKGPQLLKTEERSVKEVCQVTSFRSKCK